MKIPKVNRRDYQPYRETEDLYEGLRQQLPALEAEYNRKCKTIGGNLATDHAIQAYLDGETPGPQPLGGSENERLQLWVQLHALPRAIEMQREKRDDISREASRELAKQHNFRAGYGQIQRGIYGALKQVGEWCKIEREYRHALLDGKLEVSTCIGNPNVWMPDPGTTDDPDSLVSVFAKQAEGQGYEVR